MELQLGGIFYKTITITSDAEVSKHFGHTVAAAEHAAPDSLPAETDGVAHNTLGWKEGSRSCAILFDVCYVNKSFRENKFI